MVYILSYQPNIGVKTLRAKIFEKVHKATGGTLRG